MIAVLVLAALFVALAVFSFGAIRWGVDSREDSSDPRRPDYPVGIE
jgi:hypothetical protein